MFNIIKYFLTFLAIQLITSQMGLTQPFTQEGFRAWLKEFRPTAINEGITAETYDRLTQAIIPDFRLPDLGRPGAPGQGEQPEFVKTPKDYLSEKHMANLIATGRRLSVAHRRSLQKIEARYGVPFQILLGLWGRETAFGSYKLPYNAIAVLAVQAYAGRRRDEFRPQFIDALRMVQDGARRPEDMHSSWAGAMGLTQFLPSDYFAYAVDADGDGRKDIWNSVPDALSSLANNLNRIGWRREEPWGREIEASRELDCALGNLDIRKPVSEWTQLGARLIESESFTPALMRAETSLLQPAGVFGPAFLTFQNFQVLREYNRSDLYALFVAHLADRIEGRPAFRGGWKPVTQILSTDVEDMQRRLAAIGLYQDKVDGKAGGRTRTAVGLYQKRAGLPVTCWPSMEVVTHLRRGVPLQQNGKPPR